MWGVGMIRLVLLSMGLVMEITMSLRDDEKMVIAPIEGTDLPTDPAENVASIAIQAMLDRLGSKQGFDITIKKLFKPGSGLGSSASSSAGAVFGANILLDKPFRREELLEFALEGEAFASKSYHADNVGPVAARWLQRDPGVWSAGHLPGAHTKGFAGDDYFP